jgi:hypothetical protein
VTVAKFLTEPNLCPHPDTDALWVLQDDLEYQPDILDVIIHVPSGFVTDLASVPVKWAHREAILHDAMYRIDFAPEVSRYIADRIFLEAMICRGKPAWVFTGMFLGVRLFGFNSYHKKHMAWKG